MCPYHSVVLFVCVVFCDSFLCSIPFLLLSVSLMSLIVYYKCDCLNMRMLS